MSPTAAGGDRPPAGAPELARGERPDDPVWRADALAGSRHSRLADQLLQPLEDRDAARASVICATVCRQVLRDFAPALILLPVRERERLQTLAAYALTLFDFARQSGLEGERLAAINRWEFQLEQTLDGRPPGQPIFVRIADLEQRAPWSREGLERLHAAARQRATVPRPATAEALAREAEQLGGALATLMLGEHASPRLGSLAGSLARLRSLVELGDDLRRRRARLPVSELPRDLEPETPAARQALAASIRLECERIAPCLLQREAIAELPADLRPAARYARLVSLDLLRRIEAMGAGLVERPPGVGLARRIVLLLRAWLGA